MKKVLLLMLLFPAILNCQISKNIFPKIGFYDYHWAKNYYNLPISDYHYNELSQLGLTHLVTYADTLSNNKHGFQILDDNMSWFSCHPKQGESYFYPYFYCHATGNENNSLPYEVGGEIASVTSKNDNWGFGADNSNFVSRYFLINPGPSSTVNYDDYDEGYNVHVFRSVLGTHSQGIFLTAELRDSHQPNSKIVSWDNYIDYFFSLRARIVAHGNPADTICKIRIYESDTEPFPAIKEGISQKFNLINGDVNQNNWTDVTFAVLDSDFVGTGYNDIIKGPFNKIGDTHSYFKIKITWMSMQTLLVDKFSVYDGLYKNLFLSGSARTTYWGDTIKNQFSRYFGYATNNDSISHLYIDEPYLLMNRAYDFVSNQFSQIAIGKYVNGCNISYSQPDYQTESFLRKAPYMSMDYYPFKRGILSSTSNVQDALDSLISKPTEPKGLRAAINWAQNFNNDGDPAHITDDSVFYQAIQVDASTSNSVNSNDHRIPSKEEILEQGNLALCYGAKGIMYFALYTMADPNYCSWGKSWGLFDSNDSLTETNYPDNIQPITASIKPNSRFYAVKELNASIDKISSELLQLTWLNSYSIHLGETPYGNYVSEIRSFVPPNQPPVSTDMGVTYVDNSPNIPGGNGPNSTYVELGEFRKTTAYTNNNLEYFFLVNRLTGSSENKIIRILLDKGNSVYNNWNIMDVGSKRQWTMNKTGYFSDYFEPGTGKLYRFSPVTQQGGTINFDEAISGTNTLTDTMTIGSGATLTINGTYNVNANIVIEPGGNLIVSQGGHLNFANGCSLIYTCPQISLTALIEAMYVAGGTQMTMAPTVIVELHNSISPYALVESDTATLSTAGVGTFCFTSAVNNTPYYIVFKYLNTVETWSAIPLSFTNDTLSYDFTSGVGQAYTDGSNPPLANHNGKYCIYSGDCNQDGQVTTDDYTGLDNDNANFDYHLVNDVNGDGWVTSDDYTFIDNNNILFIQKQVPPGAPSIKRIRHQAKLVGNNKL
ncbi:MAG: hypothetical protein P4L35_05015 [Ignavibacteriaceae bacterium]|nr:hypothetical protein [Ignavibacteriaceae bacterium]